MGRGVSEFIITGRGGLPPTPKEALRSDAVQVDLGTPIQGGENRERAAIPANPITESAITRIVEAQGWLINVLGEVVRLSL